MFFVFSESALKNVKTLKQRCSELILFVISTRVTMQFIFKTGRKFTKSHFFLVSSPEVYHVIHQQNQDFTLRNSRENFACDGFIITSSSSTYLELSKNDYLIHCDCLKAIKTRDSKTRCSVDNG